MSGTVSKNGKTLFAVTVCISDRLEDCRKPENVLFFTWSNSPHPQYIPLRPVFERLENNPHRDRLMASLYRWLYGAASKVFDAFGFDEAKSVYAWRKEWYAEARENGEDVDVEGEVEASDPAKVVSYIRNSETLALKDKEATAAISSIRDEKLRSAFANAQQSMQPRVGLGRGAQVSAVRQHAANPLGTAAASPVHVIAMIAVAGMASVDGQH